MTFQTKKGVKFSDSAAIKLIDSAQITKSLSPGHVLCYAGYITEQFSEISLGIDTKVQDLAISDELNGIEFYWYFSSDMFEKLLNRAIDTDRNGRTVILDDE